jgi:rfaE bifunctional protein nucleotidyltransferase chain/domain
MSHKQKVILFKEAPEFFQKLRNQGKKIVQCHGTFDLIHPGHIYHFEEAKELGDVLVVTVTGEKHVNKGPGRPYFNDKMRSKNLAALECVDYVVVIPYPAAVEAIECVKPDIYCKGKEYIDRENDVTGNIHDDVATVEKLGGQVRYVGSVVFSSTKLLNKHFDNLHEDVKRFCGDVSRETSGTALCQAVNEFSKSKVLLIGDIIFDKYSYVKVLGLTSKASIISARLLSEDLQTGGVLAVFRHLRQFTENVTLLSLSGTESWAKNEINEHIPENSNSIIRDEAFTTIVKQRFTLPPSPGNQMAKLFSVNVIDDNEVSPETMNKVLDRLKSELPKHDIVLVTDFGHGLMQASIREYIQKHASFMALNCQTNSYNHGFNIINRQYKRTDCFSLDATEISLSAGKRHMDFTGELDKLRSELNAKYAWLTRGSIETIALKENNLPCVCPPFETDIVDTVGAGDAFFSVAALAAANGMSNQVALFLGQLAGAQAVKIVGNTEPISKVKLLKSIVSLTNF